MKSVRKLDACTQWLTDPLSPIVIAIGTAPTAYTTDVTTYLNPAGSCAYYSADY